MPGKRRYKVLLFSAQWPEYMIELANALAELDEVWLMQSVNHRFTPRHRELISSKVHFIPYNSITHQSRLVGMKSAFQILFQIWRIRPDILHLQANGDYSFLWVFNCLPKKIKIVNTIHDPVLHLGDELSLKVFNQRVVDIAIKHTSHYIVHGEFLKKQLAETYHAPIDCISVIPHGHFEIYKKFQTAHYEEDRFTALFFGRIWAYKGIKVFIEAINIVVGKYPEFKAMLVGKGDDLKEYLELIKYPKNVEIVNERVHLEDVGYYFERSSIVVLPYLDASQSGVIPVAYAYNRGVIVTNVGSIPEVVEEGKTGFIVNPNSAEEIADKLILLLHDPVMNNLINRNAYEYAIANLSWTIIAQKTQEVYGCLLKKE